MQLVIFHFAVPSWSADTQNHQPCSSGTARMYYPSTAQLGTSNIKTLLPVLTLTSSKICSPGPPQLPSPLKSIHPSSRPRPALDVHRDHSVKRTHLDRPERHPVLIGPHPHRPSLEWSVSVRFAIARRAEHQADRRLVPRTVFDQCRWIGKRGISKINRIKVLIPGDLVVTTPTR